MPTRAFYYPPCTLDWVRLKNARPEQVFEGRSFSCDKTPDPFFLFCFSLNINRSTFQRLNVVSCQIEVHLLPFPLWLQGLQCLERER